MRTWHLYILKVIPCKIFANYGEKNSNFMIGKPSRHHQSPVNKILITSNKVHSHYAPCLCEAMRRACPFSHIPAQNVWSESNREPRINTYLGTFSEKAMTPHSSTLAWKIPWVEEPGGLPSMGSRRIGHDWATSLSLFTFTHWRRKWQPTPVFLPGESQGRGSLVGCRLWGRTELNTTEVT